GDHKLKLIHVMNAYSVPGPDNSTVSPFDQWSTIQSIQRAKRFAPPDLEIEFVCAMFKHDLDALPDLPCRKVLLTRSTKTEYPFFENPKELPFIQDIIDAAVKDDIKKGNRNFFVILTNSDISLTKKFYQILHPHLQTRDAITINRLTIPTPLFNETHDAKALLEQVDAVLHQGQTHPGHDCFVMHASVLRRFRFGNMFAGHPPWGTIMQLALRIMARNFTSFASSVNGTFHLGNDNSRWSNSNDKTYKQVEKDFWFVDLCPVTANGKHPYTILNTINCGKLFEYHRFYKNHTMPNFVQPGYEDWYLERYHDSLRYTGPGGRGKAVMNFAEPLSKTKQAALQAGVKARVEQKEKSETSGKRMKERKSAKQKKTTKV
ncbi:MAG: hypothetical protein SGILL_006270, partial [Bacillariaceae sp.]